MKEGDSSGDSVQTHQRVRTVCLIILATVATGAALHWLSAVLLPFVLAVFFAYAIAPLVTLLQHRLKLPRLLAVGGAFLVGLIALASLGLLIAMSVGQLSENQDLYQQRLKSLVTQTAEFLRPMFPEEAASWLDVPPTEPLEPTPDATPTPTPSPPSEIDSPDVIETEPLGPSPIEPATQAPAPLMLPVQSVRALLVATAESILGLLSNGVLVLIFMLFLLVGGSRKMNLQRGIWGDIQKQIRTYLVTKFLVSLATGVWTYAILWVFGVDLAMVFALLAFLLNFIPSIGSIIGTLLPLPMVLLNPDFQWWDVLVVIGLLGVGQFLLGNVIEPRMMGRSMDLHPITVLLMLIFWGTIWGVVGMILAVPITAISKILIEKFELTRPVADLMAGRLDRLGAGGESDALT